MTVRIPSTAEAYAASVALAQRLGLQAEDAQIVSDGYSLRVRIGPIITRVMTAGVMLRGNPWPWLSREVKVAQWLASREAAVVRPWTDAGPHDIDGICVSAWTVIDSDGSIDAAAATGDAVFGRSIGELHACLQHCPVDLPFLAAPLADITTALRRSAHPVLHRAAAALLPQLKHWPRRPLHGDAHKGNLLWTSDGPFWIDFEDSCSGPAEWDLSSATLTQDAIEAYPFPLDERRLAACQDLRRLQVLASLLVSDEPQSNEFEMALAVLAARY